MTQPPAQWENDVVLTDGGVVHLRPIGADDRDRLLGLYERLSDESIYLRFFSPVPRPTAARLEHLTRVDLHDRFALVATLRDEIVAVARYDRVGADEAEVAFTVQDDQHGRGLATIMLEHLAAIARANGIGRFIADTLPSNRKMLNVFRDAGWEVDRRFEEGTIRVAFSIEPTNHSLSVVHERERVAEARSVARLLAPTSIAVVGASRDPGTIGHELFRNLLAYGFQGPVYPVNPASAHVAGVRAYPSMRDVPDAVDLAVVVVPATQVLSVVGDCAEKGVHGLVIVSAGFAETGDEGRRRQRDVLDLARRHGMRVIGPNCLGVVNTAPGVRMNATFSPVQPVHGTLAFLSQSGGLGIELMHRAGRIGLGISAFVSVGNKADVSGNDLLQHWEQDPGTDVILLYLESFGNPRKFARLARRVARRKPIVAVKGGRTRAGTRAASSHTAAMAAPDVAVDALFRQTGVIRVDTLEQLLDTAQVLAHQPLPAGRRVAIVGNAGGPGILAADACVGAGLEVPELAAETQASIRRIVETEASVHNPIDLVAGAPPQVFEQTLRLVLHDDAIDAVLVIFVPPLVTRADDVAAAISRAGTDAAGKPVVACFLGRDGVPDALRGDEERRTVPSFAFPESAAHALARAADLADWRGRPTGTVPTLDRIDVDAARTLVAQRLRDAGPGGTWLTADDTGALLGCFGIPVLPTEHAAGAEAAVAASDRLGYPVALKAGAPGIVHKSDVGGVALGLADEAGVRRAYERMEAHLGDGMGGSIVQPMASGGVETIVGVTHDPSFGPLVMFGAGGTAAELMLDRALRVLPLTDVDAAELVRSLRTSPLLFGYRNTPAVDVDALEDLLLRVGMLADEVPEVAEMDANPVIVSAQGAVAVDVKVRLSAGEPFPPADLRRLRV